MAADDKPENPWTDSAASTFDGKQYSQYFDPCQEAASKSLRCLHRNGGDREMCSDYFQYAFPAKSRMEARKEAKRKENKSFW
ncbi:Mitochondrial copper homeostasis protein [Diplodia seriata]